MTLFPQPFGTLPDGRTAQLHRLAHREGIEVLCSTYGATLVALTAPTRNGERAHLLLGYDNLEAYQGQAHYCGAIVGRYANRIQQGQITLNGTTYQLTQNTPPHHLHGGRGIAHVADANV
jgi:aldose 1-epimerase